MSFEFIMINILGGDDGTMDEDEEIETDCLCAVAMTAMSAPVRMDDESRLLGPWYQSTSSQVVKLATNMCS